MTYSYRDTTVEVTPVTDSRPAEAVSVNGKYIEDAISGYTTLYTKGREALAVEIDSYSVGSADGETIRGKRYPARTLTIGFQLVASSASDFRDKFNHLNNILSFDEADFIFADETDKFFTGVPVLEMSVESGRNAITGEWQIFCSYPFKRKIAYTTQFPISVGTNSATFEFTYNGTQPAHPVLRAEFAGALSGGDYSEDGDCGYVAFTDTDGNIIQLGNPDIIDLDGTAHAGLLVSHLFTDITGWETTGGKSWGSKTLGGAVSPNQTITDANWNRGAGQTLKFVKPSSFGSGATWHGPILYDTTVGAVNFEINCVHRLCVSDSAQGGSFEVGAYNNNSGTYKMIAGIVISKTGNGTSGTVTYIINDKAVGSDSIDLSYYNGNFGYCNTWAIYTQEAYYVKKKVKTKKGKKKKKKVKMYRDVYAGQEYTQSNLNTRITKSGSQVVFNVGGLSQRTFNVNAITSLVSHNVSFHFGQYGTMAPFHTNAVHTVDFRAMAGPKFADTQNVFTANDIVEADCSDASVTLFKAGTLEGSDVPMYGALGNDWEDFVLKKGTNVIAATWSPWVNVNYKPTLKIIYNEVFL